MILACTCGAVLPPDARFCHKCGKPQYEEQRLLEDQDFPMPAAAPAPLAAATSSLPPAPPPISFRNATAVRIGFLTAMGTFVVLLIPLPLPLALIRFVVVPLAAGFLSVYWYRRRTGQSLTVRGGARMGWITGMFCFMIGTVLFTVSIVILSQPELADYLRQQGQSSNGQDVDKMLEVLKHARESVPEFLVTLLVFLFGAFGFIPTVGGALGAKVLEKD